MSFARSTDRPVRARPVADAPVEELLARAEELARGWAVALILARPLAAMTELPLEDVARSAPALCEALVRALASDESLERLAATDAGAAPLASLRALAGDSAALVADVDALRAILWEATREELRDPPARVLADLADRLAHVCAAALAATLRTSAEHAPATRYAHGPTRVPYRAEGDAAARAGGAVLVDELGVEPRPLVADESSGEPAPSGHVADASGVPAYEPGPPPREVRATPGPGSESTRAAPRARPWDTPLEDGPTMRVRRGPGVRVDEPR